MRLIKDDIVRVCDQAVTQFCRVSGLPADDRLLQVAAIRPHLMPAQLASYSDAVDFYVTGVIARPNTTHRPQAHPLGPAVCNHFEYVL